MNVDIEIKSLILIKAKVSLVFYVAPMRLVIIYVGKFVVKECNSWSMSIINLENIFANNGLVEIKKNKSYQDTLLPLPHFFLNNGMVFNSCIHN